MKFSGSMWGWAAGTIAACGVGLAAQSQAPAFRGGVALVTVDVAVFDGQGRPIPGLDADAFEVTLNGRRQPIKVVSYLEARGERAQPSPASAPDRPEWDGRAGRQVITNDGVLGPSEAVGEDRVFVILIDDLSIPPTRGRRVLSAAQDFVARLPATDPVGLVRSSNAGDAVNPTLNRRTIHDALAQTSGSLGDLSALRPQGAAADEFAGPDGFVGVSQALDIDYGVMEALKLAIARACFGGDRSEVDAQVLDVLIAQNGCASEVRQQARQTAAMAKRVTSLQIDAYEAAIRAMGTADGIRHLVLVSDGLAVGRDAQQLTRLARAAAEAGVQVSVLMEEHDLSLSDEGRRAVGGTPQVDIGSAQRRLEDQRMYMDGLQIATGLVGGQFYRIVGDPLPFFERVRTASAAIYRLGIEPPPNLKTGQVIQVNATVRRSGASVFVNRHALVPAAAPALPAWPRSTDDRLRDALSAGEQHGAVPLQMATLLRRSSTDAGQVEVTLAVEVPGGAAPVRGPVIAMFGVVPAGQGAPTAGAAMTSGRRVLDAPGSDGAFHATFAIPLPPGDYHLRVAVADADGALGALATDLDASLTTVGPFAASDLLVAWVDEAGRPQLMALDGVPASATGVRFGLDLYPPTAPPARESVQVEFLLSRVGEPDSIDERLLTPGDVAGVWRAATEFSTDALAAGRYIVRARVYVGDDVVGSTIATFSTR